MPQVATRHQARVLWTYNPHTLKQLVKESTTSLGKRIRKPLTTFGFRSRTRVGCWNIRTMFEAGRLDQVAEEKKRFKIDILGLSETNRRRGRPRETWRRTTEREIEREGKSWSQIKVLAKNRVRWKKFVAALCSSKE